MQAAQHTTEPIMIAATGPSAAPRPISTTSSSDANRIVQMVMPETGLFDEPTRPAMYAETDVKTKPATIMITVITRLMPMLSTMSW
jgi:hypothetical protein